jgi:hypothetical protein
MRKFARVQDDPRFVRDIASNAVLSKDREAYENRKRFKKEQTDKNNLEKTVEDLLKRVAVLERQILQNG